MFPLLALALELEENFFDDKVSTFKTESHRSGGEPDETCASDRLVTPPRFSVCCTTRPWVVKRQTRGNQESG